MNNGGPGYGPSGGSVAVTGALLGNPIIGACTPAILPLPLTLAQP